MRNAGGLSAVVCAIGCGTQPAPATAPQPPAPRAAISSEPPATKAPEPLPEVPKVPADASAPEDVELAARRAVSELEPLWTSGSHLGKGVRHCDGAVCAWRFLWGSGTNPTDTWGTIEVVEGTNEAFFESRGELSQRVTIPQYKRLDALAREVITAVLKSQPGRAACAQVTAQGLACDVTPTAWGKDTCPPDARIDDPCLWTVSAVAHAAAETFRFRTFVVDPGRMTVRGVYSDLCGAYSLAFWKKHAARIGSAEDREQCPKETAR